jgi:hypothetical protein
MNINPCAQLHSPHYPTPRTPLPRPAQLSCDRPQVTLGDRRLTAGYFGEKQNRFLDVRGQVQQVHDLGHPGRGHLSDAGDLGLIGYEPEVGRFQRGVG